MHFTDVGFWGPFLEENDEIRKGVLKSSTKQFVWALSKLLRAVPNPIRPVRNVRNIYCANIRPGASIAFDNLGYYTLQYMACDALCTLRTYMQAHDVKGRRCSRPESNTIRTQVISPHTHHSQDPDLALSFRHVDHDVLELLHCKKAR